MKLTLQRRPSSANCTIGELAIDGVFECYTLEDVVREAKIAGETAIPAGEYRLIVTRSPRFARDLPLLLKVPGFEGVRIHPGNSAADTEGCILVGKRVAMDTVVESRLAFAAVFDAIQGAIAYGEQVWLEVLPAEA